MEEVKIQHDVTQIENLLEKSHPLIERCIIDMIAANYLPFYGEFALFLTFIEASMGSMGVTCDSKGPKLMWDSKFIDGYTDKYTGKKIPGQTLESMNFLLIHEIFHLLWDHIERGVGYDQKFANLAQDMIINSIIYEDIVLGENNKDKVWMPKDYYGNNSGVFVPKEYNGELIFESLYRWLKKGYEDYKKNKEKKGKCSKCGGTGQVSKNDKKSGKKKQQGQQQGGQGQSGEKQGQSDQGQSDQGQSDQGQSDQGQGNQMKTCPDCGGSGENQQGGQGQSGGKQGQGNPDSDYGPYGKKISGQHGEMTPEMYSLESIYDNIEKNKGMTMDVHLQGGDQMPKEVKREMVDRILNNLKNRGLMKGNGIMETLRKLRKSEKDYLKEIKRSITSEIMEGKKNKSITRPHRRGVWGLKGKRKFKQKINAVLDTSGSMNGEFEKALSFIFQNDISINLIQIDTEIQEVKEIKSKHELEKVRIKGLGGTILSPAIQHIANNKNLNQYNTVVLTDGYTDDLNLKGIKGNVLVLSTASKCGIVNSKTKVKQIVIEKKNS